MEKVLFDWSGWDGDHECMNFYDVVLKQDIGPYKIGTKFSGATIDAIKGILQFFENEKMVAEYNIHYTVQV